MTELRTGYAPWRTRLWYWGSDLQGGPSIARGARHHLEAHHMSLGLRSSDWTLAPASLWYYAGGSSGYGAYACCATSLPIQLQHHDVRAPGSLVGFSALSLSSHTRPERPLSHVVRKNWTV